MFLIIVINVGLKVLVSNFCIMWDMLGVNLEGFIIVVFLVVIVFIKGDSVNWNG